MKAFISYSHKDEEMLGRLHTHLKPLRRSGLLESWYDREIIAGSDLDSEISREMSEARLFLMMVSPDFLASDYCVDKEMSHAIDRHNAGSARVVPIILEPCSWEMSPLSKLKAVPKDGKPISTWSNQNEAFHDAVGEIVRIIESNGHGIMKSTTPTAPQSPPIPPNGGADEQSLRDTADAPPIPPMDSQYKIKREFDAIDVNEYRDYAFAVIRDYFEIRTAEINSIPKLRGRFTARTDAMFNCTAINSSIQNGTAHIWVFTDGGNGSMATVGGEITISFDEGLPTNSANGWFRVVSDDHELYLEAVLFSHGFQPSENHLSPEAAAEILWLDFIGRAGITLG